MPLLFVFLISLPIPGIEKRSIYMDRYLMPVVPALIVLVALGARTLAQRYWRLSIALAAYVGFVICLSLANMYFNPVYARDDWRGVGEYVRVHADSANAILALDPSMSVPYAYYDRARLKQLPLTITVAELIEQLDTQFRLNPATQVWLFTWSQPANAHRFLPDFAEQTARAHRDVLKRELDTRYKIEYEQLFQAVFVTAYRGAK